MSVSAETVNIFSLPSEAEYRESIATLSRFQSAEYSEPKYLCSKCGGGMCRNELEVCACLPSKFKYRCNQCGNVEYQCG